MWRDVGFGTYDDVGAAMVGKRLLGAFGALALGLSLTGCGLAEEGGGGGDKVVLRLSHQWPAVNKKGEGDFRSVIAQRFADDVKKRTDGEVVVKIHAANSLIEDPIQQYTAINKGTADMSVYPLDYAAGDVPAFSVTLMPAMVRNHEQARKWQNAQIGKEVEKLTEDNGIKVLTWIWNAGAIGSRSAEPIVAPDDVKKGNVTRAAGPRIEQMLKSVGFGLSSMPSSEIYNGMQTGVLDSAITSTSSFGSYRLHEQVKSFTTPTGGNTFWFMFEPLIIGTEQFDELTKEQQQAVEKAGANLQQYAYEASEKDDTRVEQQFKKAGVKVVPMDDASYEKWREKSEPVWDDFAKEVEGGQRLIDEAKKVADEG
ncbi:MAG: C4-dicarboxylate ABC transporter substrate-binding protein [Streptosporangiales bacterium]|nr:C4-dicarboxylate ABC transporter substrate-binding protein [Streptosporangiales bacterium]